MAVHYLSVLSVLAIIYKGLLALGSWLLALGSWLLAIGSWLRGINIEISLYIM